MPRPARRRLPARANPRDRRRAERKLYQISLEIKDGIPEVHGQMSQARRRRAVGATGAAIGTVSAVLVAVYGKTLADAVAAGASGDVRQVTQAADNTRGSSAVTGGTGCGCSAAPPRSR